MLTGIENSIRTVSRGDQHIRCEIAPIPTAGGAAYPSRHALFFHRFGERITDSERCSYLPRCSVHNGSLAAVQCTDCVKFGLPLKQSYHCSQMCFQNAWKKHLFNHLCAAKDHFPNGDVKMGRLRGWSSWPPADRVSWFDERVQVACPGGKSRVSKLGSSNAFVPVADDAGFCFELGSAVVGNLHGALPIEDVTATDPAGQRRHLSHRRVLHLADIKKSEMLGVTKKVSTLGSFSVLTYNILADIDVHSEKYSYCPPWALTWEYRRTNLLHEILLYDADILCLQEVQSDHFENFFEPQLMKFGYSAIYKRKANEVYTGNGYTSEGCAIFFRNHVFKGVAAYELEYSKTALALIEKLEPRQRDQAKIRLIKDNIALVVILEMVDSTNLHTASGSRLCVVCTHIYGGKNSPDVKLLQVSDLVSEIEKIIDQRTPLFICGDINSVLEGEESKLRSLVVFGSNDPYTLLANHECNPALGVRANDPLDIFRHLKLHHSMKLASAYALASAPLKTVDDTDGDRMIMMDPTTGKPSCTSWTLNYKSTLDYIFYTEDSLEVEGLLEIPDSISDGWGLPSPLWSSDHIALMGRFRITRPFLG